jgi:hypothetical protein
MWTRRIGTVHGVNQKRCSGLGQDFATALNATQRCDDRHLASILGLTFETLKALIQGFAVSFRNLTAFETVWPCTPVAEICRLLKDLP